jgi:kynurenine formamidase
MGRVPFEHRIQPIAGVGWDDVLDSFNSQGSTQWDGFGHGGSAVHGHYGGLGRDDHGVDHWAARSFATRGVLADVARWREKQSRPFDAAGGEVVPVGELLATLEDQGSVVEPGDILLIRFGWMQWWRSGGSSTATSLVQPGLEPSLRTVEVLWDLHIAAVGCDPALDPMPAKWETLPAPPTREQLADPAYAFSLTLHSILPYLGLSIGEFFDLDALAEDCAATDDWSCMITTAPMQLPGGVATPANAIAVR